MKDIFYNEPQEARITVDIGDFRITMNGMLEPPTIDKKMDNSNFIYERDFYGLSNPYVPLSSWINLKLKTSDSVKIDQIKWEIPIAKKAWIEND
jgi:hypothetical protein